MNFNFNFHSHNVHLFAYYLSQPIDSFGEYQSDWLWEKCNRIVHKTLGAESEFNIQKHLNLENQAGEAWANLNKYHHETDEYYPIYVQSDRFFIDKNESKIDSDSKTAIIYPVQLYNSYCLGLKLIFPNIEHCKTLEKKDILKANPSNCLMLDAEDKKNEYFLGQTLLITINLKPIYKLKHKSNKEKLRQIADNYLNALLPGNIKKPPFNRSGELFGSPIFEYGIIREVKSYSHVLIWFILDDKSQEKFDNNYHQLLDLFLFRAKIIHAYKQIQGKVKQAKDKSKEIQTKIKISQNYHEKDNELDLDLNTLHNFLVELPTLLDQYVEKVRFLKELQNIIVDNTRDYSDKIYEIKSNFPDEDLSFLEHFNDKTCNPFQERVTAAVQFFQLDTNLINNGIDSIKGQVAIEQAHRERQLQSTITSLGIGIAAAGNFASSYEAGSIAEKKEEKNNDQLAFDFPHFIISFVTSMLIGFIVWQAFSRFFSWWYKEEQLTKPRKLKFNLFPFRQKKQDECKQEN